MLECKSKSSSKSLTLIYVNLPSRFVDRDMYMRHLGLGVGHKRENHGSDDDQSVEVDSLDFRVHLTPEPDNNYDSEPEIDGNEENRGNEEDQEEDSEEEEEGASDEETGGDNEEHDCESEGSEDEEDNGYDEL
jgi:hypothetical protein